MADGFGHGVDVAGRAGHRLRQHLAVAVEDAGRQVARFAHAGAEGGAHQRQRLLLDDRDQPVPHDLHVDVDHRADSPSSSPDLAVSAAGLHEQAAVGLHDGLERRRSTMVDVSRSTMTAGPRRRRRPRGRRDRRPPRRRSREWRIEEPAGAVGRRAAAAPASRRRGLRRRQRRARAHRPADDSASSPSIGRPKKRR